MERGKAGGEAAVSVSPSEARHNNGPGENEKWSPKLLRLLYEQSPPAMVLILDYLAENPDREVTSGELVELLKQRKPDVDSNTLAGTLGAFGRRVANHYGMKGGPFKAYYSHEHHSVVCLMDGWVAEKTRGLKAG